jgi:hypothetical protein
MASHVFPSREAESMSAPLNDLMMNDPLTLTHFFERSRRLFAKKTLATRVPGRPLFRYTYADIAERTMRQAGPVTYTHLTLPTKA